MSYISAMTDNDMVTIWERDPVTDERTVHKHKAPYYFYIDDPDGKYLTIYDTRVSKVVCKSSYDYRAKKQMYEQEGIEMWESDIPAEIRFLSNNYYNVPAPKLHIGLLDIEVDYDPDIGFSSVDNPYAPINAVSIYHYYNDTLSVFCVPPRNGTIVPPGGEWTDDTLTAAVNDTLPIPLSTKLNIMVCQNEQELLLALLDDIQDCDLLCGWNSEFFDFPYIHRRVEMILGKRFLSKLSFPGARTIPLQLKDVPRFGDNIQVLKMDIQGAGRIYADYMELYRKYEFGERQSYKLAVISEAVLVDDKTHEPLLPKLEYSGTLFDLYRKDFPFFIRYNIRDVEILKGFEDKLGYIDLANQMYHLSTAQFQHVPGTLKLHEYAIVNHCHHQLKRVVNNVRTPLVDEQIDGALVLEPKVGLHSMIGSIDINSLYPSAIRSLNISPETLRGQFVSTSEACLAISENRDDVQLTFVDELTKENIVKPACEWRTWLLEKRWAVSGYGTVFDQNVPGIIPTILAEWYSTRKKYQALKKDAEKAGDEELANYYDRLQYVYKIKLNSLYGALTNLYFRFYDLRMGESTTGSGRMILRHQCSYTNEVLTGVYDLTGEAVIYGDTDSTYFATFADNTKDAIKIANAVADKVNDSYPEFMRTTFLCSSGYDNLIKAGREIVSDRGIFVEKKRYILHLVDKENKAVDDLKVMGLDTKKTTLPTQVGDALNKFIERFLKGETWESVSCAIVDYKEALRNSENILDVGLPKGVKNVDLYTKEYESLGMKARLPGHVAASIYYNMCLREYGDKVSMPITNGMKIKVFYLQGKHGKFKSIALPTDTEIIPTWFTDNFKIDYEAQILRLVDRPISNILKAIGKQAPSKHSVMVESLWEF